MNQVMNITNYSNISINIRELTMKYINNHIMNLLIGIANPDIVN